MTWINCGNYIQLSRFFMYPNTTAKNFIARHVFIVSHPLQGHHQRYSSEPEIPPKADRRSTQSTMKSVMIRHHEICIQGTHPSVPHLPEPVITSNELFKSLPIWESLSAFLTFLTFLTIRYSHISHAVSIDLAPWAPLQAYQARRFVWLNERSEVLKASEDDYEVFWSGVSKNSIWNSESNRFRAAFISNWSIHDVTPKQLEGLVSTLKIRTKWLAQENIHASKKLLLTIAWPKDSNFTNMRSMQAV